MSKIRHAELVIDDQEPFKNCVLNRKKYADVLTSIVNSYSDGFVLAINNEWGAGKTTFVKMWQNQLQNEGFQTLYFNAWENDFDTYPLVALMAELKELAKPATEKAFKNLVQKGAVVVKKVLPHIAKAVAKKYLGEEAVSELVGDSADAATEILSDEINDFAKKKDGLKDFRSSLANFVATTKADNKPLIFMIDELDRCRPNYAVELLEQIKHLFSVSGIVFVLSIDKDQLGNAVKGFYGSDRINSEEYLRRFIDLEYALPKPDAKQYITYLCTYFGFDKFFQDRTRKNREFESDEPDFIMIMTSLIEKSGTSLRKIEKLFSHASIGLNTINERQYVHVGPYCIIAFIKLYNPFFYNSIKSKELTNQDFIDQLSNFFSKQIDDYDLRAHVWMESLLITMYANYCKDYSSEKLTETDPSGIISTVVKTGFTQATGNSFMEALSYYSKGGRSGLRNVSLITILNRIELFDNNLS